MRTVVVRVVGVTFENRQEILARIDARRDDWTVGIRREPDNPYDPNALAVIARGPWPGSEELCVGYIRRELAAQWKDAKKFVITRWTVIGGDGRKYGMELNVIPLGAKVTSIMDRRQVNLARQKRIAARLVKR